MADQLIPVQSAPGAAATEVTQTAAVDGSNDNQFSNDQQGKLLIFVLNGSGSATGIIRSVPCSHGRTEDITWTVDADTLYVIGPLPATLFVNSDGLIEINIDDTDDTTLWAIVVPEAG